MKSRFLKKTAWLMMVTICGVACANDDDSIVNPSSTIQPGNDPNFTIVANKDAGFGGFNRKVEVFGISIYAVATVEDVKLLHAANLMAQYLDNNEDGVVDNPKVLAAMKDNKAFLVMWKKESDLDNLEPPSGAEGQDLGNDETVPGFVSGGKAGQFDAALEEVWHIITHAGYASAYPDVFGESAGTSLSNAMDIARGGNFTTIPNPYPSGAWYTYDDATCDYNCMVTEYIYWAMTSILGAQENRLNEISQEWDLNTEALVQSTDVAIYQLLTDSQYKFPTVLPDGTYKR
ncbi:hypothetical protein QQ020_13815 [Fulvivirgaceae bacterium BMA12]|uniref:Uncharacterized protein n=1 Tax=Agaribacillus aureus TaxID=3051825 RepID=A0ABT8L5X1_9BACT|nr:hypothetical protein [Fulvivirgaceae bacterium BMA12]